MGVIYDEQADELELARLARDILGCAQSELYLNMRYLDMALSALSFIPDKGIKTAGTNGSAFYFNPEEIARLFRKRREEVNRLYLHSLLHCLFFHLWQREGREKRYWDLACDIAVEHSIDNLTVRAVRRAVSALRRELYHALSVESKTLTAQRVYTALMRFNLSESQFHLLSAEFSADDHSRWEDENNEQPSEAKKRWDEAQKRMSKEMQILGPEAANEAGSLTEQLGELRRRPVDYRDFLRKFSVLKEEMQVDPDSYDYIYYNYGMQLYGNMPLIEPLETREVKKVEDFVIVLDTSMSCKGELLQRFLEESYNILSESESFFRKINLRILQCDERVQEDVKITNEREMRDYLNAFTVKGYGGTDFRPAFSYVEELRSRKAFTKLKGLIYFTDGYGIFPVKKPPYDTAFIFCQERYRDVDVPPWAIKLIIKEDEL